MPLTPPVAPASARTRNGVRAGAFLLAAAALYFLFFFDLTRVGMLGPDEPRYASIAREMARSGDWITPRLAGEPWFEKPALLYWMIGAAFRLGLGPDLAPRLPVAIVSVAFLVFFYLVLRREFNARAAFFSTAILATSAGWIAYSQIGVTDLPMSATFAAAMLLGLVWIDSGDTRVIPAAAALFGFAVLAKGLVPLALALPLAWFGRKRVRDWIRPAPAAAFLIVAVPWYVLCLQQNGWAFFNDFFIRHHFARFATGALQHQQPFWFYLPVLLGGLFPWTPLLALLASKRGRPNGDTKRMFLAAWVVFGLLFFSVSTNKLPGYLLPLMPAVAALMGLALDSVRSVRVALAACAVLLAAVPIIGRILPEAIARGLTHTNPGGFPWGLLALVCAAGSAIAWAEARGHRELAFGAITVLMVAGVVWLKVETFPALDRAVSARTLWHEIAPRGNEVCVGEMHRSWRYNLDYYSVSRLPDCADQPRRLHIVQEPGRPPAVVPNAAAISSSSFPSRSSR